MPKKNKQRKANGQLSSWVALTGIPAGAQVMEVRRMTQSGNLTVGTTSNRFLTSGVTSATEWSSYSGRWTQARVLAMRILAWVPLLSMTPTASGVPAQLLAGTDRSAAVAAGASVTAVAAMQQFKALHASHGKVVQYEVKALDIEDQDYTPVGSMTAKYAMHIIFSGASGTGAPVYTGIPYILEYAVQFKGTQ